MLAADRPFFYHTRLLFLRRHHFPLCVVAVLFVSPPAWRQSGAPYFEPSAPGLTLQPARYKVNYISVSLAPSVNEAKLGSGGGGGVGVRSIQPFNEGFFFPRSFAFRTPSRHGPHNASRLAQVNCLACWRRSFSNLFCFKIHSC